jgi:lipoic acid synthetase
MKPSRKPPWLRIQINTNGDFRKIKRLVQQKDLHTVCQEAGCPNIYECWAKNRTATFMILGNICTRGCRFCSVRTGQPMLPDKKEPARIAEAVRIMELHHAVITMVSRDDLKDSGAEILTKTIEAIKKGRPGCSIEVLSSDMKGVEKNIIKIMDSRPDIFAHNIETVRRLSSFIRPQADYDRSLKVLKIAKSLCTTQTTKSSLMLGLGEVKEEILICLEDLRKCGVDIVNIGQYLQPAKSKIPVSRYWHPDEFAELKEAALDMGFLHCEAGPLVRSSYHAEKQYGKLYKR